MNHLAPVIAARAPAVIAASGAHASFRFLEFFTAQTRNPPFAGRQVRRPSLSFGGRSKSRPAGYSAFD